MRRDRQGSREFTPSTEGSYAKSSYLNSNGSINIPEMKLINSPLKMRPKLMAHTHSLTRSTLEVEFKWIIAASQSSPWRTAKGAKLCEIPLYHSYSGSNVQSQKWQPKNAAEVVPLTCCKALRKLFSLAGKLHGAQQHSHFMPVFADNVAWYFKICINRNLLNKKNQMKIGHTQITLFPCCVKYESCSV